MKLMTATVLHVASTLVANINTALLEPTLPVNFIQLKNFSPEKFEASNRLTLKIHLLPASTVREKLNALLSRVLNTYIVYVNRENHSPVNISHDNLIVLEYDKLLYKSSYCDYVNTSKYQVVDYVCDEYMSRGVSIDDDMRQSAIERIDRMDDVCKQLKHQPFGVYDDFFHIHGSHRNRDFPRGSDK